ncbi:hypothetical protein QFC20_005348 [Naganishia adeliensis]|uniref:Uncharacterized protein n=1 Tax=Naganishia adeliensis TaxID=92952 RepID=A0ACC2VPW3_9TREE|nr:hypothetical protein QFC20_005348 [Naganishia adeliensis]
MEVVEEERQSVNWDNRRRLRDSKPDNPIESLVLLSQTLGVSLLSLWKYAAAGRRILFYGSPPLTSICQAAYCTWLASLRLTQLEQRPGWIACTSDAIYKDKTGIYDLLVDCSGSEILPSDDDEGVNAAREPVMRAVVRENGQASLKYVTYTYSDTVLWNAISPLLSDQASDEGQRTAPSFIWNTAIGTYTYICDICWGLCAYAAGTAYGEPGQHDHIGGGYIRLPTEDDTAVRPSADDSTEEDDIDIADSEALRNDSRTARAIQILKILDHRRDHIEKHLARAVTETGTPTLSKDHAANRPGFKALPHDVTGV